MENNLKISPRQLTEKLREYINTPYVHGGRIKGQGVDCSGLLVSALLELNYEVINDVIHFNRGDSLQAMIQVLLYNSFQKKPGELIVEGDIVLIRTSAMHHHLVYISDEEHIIHTWITTGVNIVVESTWIPEWKDNINSVWRLNILDT